MRVKRKWLKSHIISLDKINIYVLKLRLACFKERYCSNQIFHYTRSNTLKRVSSLRGPFPRHCARATQLLSKKCRSGGKPLATLGPIRLARDSLAPETNALPLDQLASRKILLNCKMYVQV